MIVIQMYRCPTCKKTFGKSEKAKKCISSHEKEILYKKSINSIKNRLNRLHSPFKEFTPSNTSLSDVFCKQLSKLGIEAEISTSNLRLTNGPYSRASVYDFTSLEFNLKIKKFVIKSPKKIDDLFPVLSNPSDRAKIKKENFKKWKYSFSDMSLARINSLLSVVNRGFIQPVKSHMEKNHCPNDFIRNIFMILGFSLQSISFNELTSEWTSCSVVLYPGENFKKEIKEFFELKKLNDIYRNKLVRERDKFLSDNLSILRLSDITCAIAEQRLKEIQEESIALKEVVSERTKTLEEVILKKFTPNTKPDFSIEKYDKLSAYDSIYLYSK